MVPFATSSSDGTAMVERAVRSALDDAGLDSELVDQAVVSHVYGDSRVGRARARPRRHCGHRGVERRRNGEASGSSAVFHARQALLSGEAECVLAVGFEELSEAFGRSFPDRADPHERLRSCVAAAQPHSGRSVTSVRMVQLAAAQLEWMAVEMGIGDETFARVAVKSRAHAGPNPYAAHRDPVSIEEVRTSSCSRGVCEACTSAAAGLRGCGGHSVQRALRGPPWSAR